MDNKEKKVKIKKLIDKINPYFPLILSVLTIILIIVTIGSIISLVYSAKTTNRIADIEIYLAKEAKKQEIRENLNLALNLLIDLEMNELFLKDFISKEDSLKRGTEIYHDNFKILRIEQAREDPNFGNLKLKTLLESYFTSIENIKSSLSQIALAQFQNKTSLKIEHINRICGLAKKLIDEKPLREALEGYTNEKEDEYDLLEEKSKEELLKLIGV